MSHPITHLQAVPYVLMVKYKTVAQCIALCADTSAYGHIPTVMYTLHYLVMCSS